MNKSREPGVTLKTFWASLTRGGRIIDIKNEWRQVRHPNFVIFFAGAVAMFTLMFYFYAIGGRYVDRIVVPSSTDLFLEILPRWDVTAVISYAWLALHIFPLIVTFLYYPRRLPYIMSTISLFIGVRVIFLILTPLGPPTGNIDMTRTTAVFSAMKGVLAFNNENFFSGHTGIPFLFFLIYTIPWVKAVFLCESIVMGSCVLLARNHYTMDVIGAYFMTYAVYRISRYLFSWLDTRKEMPRIVENADSQNTRPVESIPETVPEAQN
ncbi:MAG: phosphatase PAP2-related protein [Elusimicrobiota bacterium]